jgi:hypothetical protein
MNLLSRRGLNAARDKPRPSLSDNNTSRSRLPASPEPDSGSGQSDEMLVVDRRAELRPAQMVELKLRELLRGKALPVSHIQMVDALRARK